MGFLGSRHRDVPGCPTGVIIGRDRDLERTATALTRWEGAIGASGQVMVFAKRGAAETVGHRGEIKGGGLGHRWLQRDI